MARGVQRGEARALLDVPSRSGLRSPWPGLLPLPGVVELPLVGFFGVLWTLGRGGFESFWADLGSLVSAGAGVRCSGAFIFEGEGAVLMAEKCLRCVNNQNVNLVFGSIRVGVECCVGW